MAIGDKTRQPSKPYPHYQPGVQPGGQIAGADIPIDVIQNIVQTTVQGGTVTIGASSPTQLSTGDDADEPMSFLGALPALIAQAGAQVPVPVINPATIMPIMLSMGDDADEPMSFALGGPAGPPGSPGPTGPSGSGTAMPLWLSMGEDADEPMTFAGPGTAALPLAGGTMTGTIGLNGRFYNLTLVNDANYTVMPADTIIIYIGLTAPRSVILPATAIGQYIQVWDGTTNGAAVTNNISWSVSGAVAVNSTTSGALLAVTQPYGIATAVYRAANQWSAQGSPISGASASGTGVITIVNKFKWANTQLFQNATNTAASIQINGGMTVVGNIGTLAGGTYTQSAGAQWFNVFTPTGSDVILQLASTSGMFYGAANSTAGAGHSIVLQTASGAPIISLPPGAGAIVACYGTNSYAVLGSYGTSGATTQVPSMASVPHYLSMGDDADEPMSYAGALPTLTLQAARQSAKHIADANYVAAASDTSIIYDSISATRTVTVPLASTFLNPYLLISDGSGSVTSLININVLSTGSDTISGQIAANASPAVAIQYGIAILVPIVGGWALQTSGIPQGVHPTPSGATVLSDTDMQWQGSNQFGPAPSGASLLIDGGTVVFTNTQTITSTLTLTATSKTINVITNNTGTLVVNLPNVSGIFGILVNSASSTHNLTATASGGGTATIVPGAVLRYVLTGVVGSLVLVQL